MKIQRKMKTWECRTWKQPKQLLWRDSTFFLYFLRNWMPVIFSRVRKCSCHHKHQNGVFGKADIKMQNIRNFHYFNGKLQNGWPKYSHFCHQRIQININHHFVVQFSQILCLSGFPLFPAAILDRRYEPRMLSCNPIQRNELKKKLTKFE